ncbi:MAG: hypothetical protein ACRDT4_08120 [Micromonosporaceae bacterium]
MTDPSAGQPAPEQPVPGSHPPPPHQPGQAYGESVPPDQAVVAPGQPYGPPAPGYGPPAPGYGPPGYSAPQRPYDPLVSYDFSSWADRVKGVVTRSWKGILTVLLLGYLVPVVLTMLVFGGIVVATAFALADAGNARPGLIAVIAVLYIGFFVVAYYLLAVSGLAATKLATNDAVGQQLSPAEALRSSTRLGWPTLGWLALGGLATMLGSLLCYLPGFYVMAASSLIIPIMAFERQGGLTGSFRLMHSRFWPAAGRFFLTLGVAMAAIMVLYIVMYAVMAAVAAMLSSTDSTAGIVVAVIAIVIMFLLMLVAGLLGQVVLMSGNLVTYAELRGHLQPGLTARQLADEVNA